MPAEFTYDVVSELLVDNSVLNVISGFTEILDPGGMTVGGASVSPVCAVLFEIELEITRCPPHPIRKVNRKIQKKRL